MFKADLHCHTTCSDGSLSPEALVALAADVGLQGLSITDHDTLEAYDTAVEAAKKRGIELLPGIELSSRDDTEPVHILGYAFALDDAPLRAFCERHVGRRTERNQEILKRLGENGFEITQADLVAFCGDATKRVYGRPHIAQVMVQKGYVKSMVEAFTHWIGEGQKCYAPGEEVSVEKTVETIHRAGGCAVIAHPHLLRHRSTLDKLLAMPFDGIEGYYGTFDRSQAKRWVGLAEKRHWLVTGGSDFHGAAKPDIPLGCSWVGEETFRALQLGPTLIRQ